jgi:predicted DNA-binding transcriptional regulator YafY
VQERHRVRFRYRDPWTGTTSRHDVEPYDVRRRRLRMFLDAGPGSSFDVSGIAGLVVDERSSFQPRALPPATERAAPVEVVLEVPDRSAAEHRLVDGWGALVVGPPTGGRLQLRVELDPLHAATRLGVLLLQLGPGCTVVSPPELVQAAVPVARRLLDTLAPHDLRA